MALGDEVLHCSLRGFLFKNEKTDSQTRPVAVGDRVRISRQDAEGAIEEVLPRHSELARVSTRAGKVQVLAANVDLVLVVVSLHRPTLRPTLVDRLVVACESEGLDVLIVLNKVDLCTAEEVEAFLAPYRGLGYATAEVSAIEGTNLGPVRAAMTDQVSLVLGHSGVGKSSLLNALDPDLRLRVGEVTRREGKGRHTTTHSQLVKVAGAGYVVDGPGIREFGLTDIDPVDLAYGFREMRPHQGKCRFATCTHTHEPECSVKDAVEAGEISEERYSSYCKLLEEREGGGERMPRHGSF